ncbi:MAG: Asp-tRNA(Asn)/Glu-tRNA(Gln) amidotransferase subunit GatB [Chlamydiales bacterium]
MTHMSKEEMLKEWEPVIGLEIHCQLNTASKLFSEAANRFGDEPNTNISEVCTGQPGSLPILNKEAVHKAVLLGCAIQADVALYSTFDRKSYFYPDSPRNFQITQMENPIIRGGYVTAEVEGQEKTFPINRIHLEDDAGMLKHFGTFAGVDYNRAGVPLVEIVSEPCMHSPSDAVAYAMAVRAILQYIHVSDCNMQEGSIRFDVNISVRKKGETKFRNKIEIKNLNSFNYMRMAIEAEIERHIRLYLSHPNEDPFTLIPQATYRWDPDRKEAVLMRRKEYAEDYRYFPEPDLLPIVLTPDYIEEVRRQLPELPRDREQRYVKEYGLKPEDAFLIVSDKGLADYFEEALKETSNARSLYNWIMVEFSGRLKEYGKSLPETGIPPLHLAQLVNFIDSETITGKIAKNVADDMLLTPAKSPEQIVKENPDYTPLSDVGAIEAIVDDVLKEHAQSVEDYFAGKDRAFGFLVGQVMKQTKGKASPQIVNTLLKEKLKK